MNKRNSELDKFQTLGGIDEQVPEVEPEKQQTSLEIHTKEKKFELNSFQEFVGRSNARRVSGIRRADTKVSKLYRTGSRPEIILQEEI